ncbi:MAG: hypothetical protein AAGD47_06080 [Pseudomonadota bacterium]
MHEFVATGIGAAMVHAATNIDNLIVLIALVLASSRGTPVVAYAIVQAGVVIAAWLVSLLAGAVDPAWVGFIGLVPIGLGLWQLAKQERAEAEGRALPAAMLGLIGLFAAMSADTFTVLLALWSDTRQTLDPAIGMGAGASLAALCVTGLFAARLGRGFQGRLGRINRYTPFIMIASGLYVLLETTTDVTATG